jgi:CRP-like cAMP-binding protein
LEGLGFKNTLLRALDEDSIRRLRLRRMHHDLKYDFEIPKRAIKSVYFLESGMASMTAVFKDGSQVEVGTFGYESVIGMSAILGSTVALNHTYTQIAGHGYLCSVESARAEFNLAGTFQLLALRYLQAQLDQAEQSIGCNVKHRFEPRLARWLLICADRADSETFIMSHDKLADMLGSTRATVSLAAGVLKKKGLIQYSRGVIKFVDRAGLEKSACECYHTIKDHLDTTRRDEVAVA